MNTEQASKGLMRRPTRPENGEGCHARDTERGRATEARALRRGIGDGMSRRIHVQHGKSLAAGRASPGGAKGVVPRRMSDGLVVPLKPWKHGGGKEPWVRALLKQEGSKRLTERSSTLSAFQALRRELVEGDKDR